MLIDYDGRDDWEEHEEMKDTEDMESDVEGDGADPQGRSLMAGRAAENPLNRICATRHELRPRAVSKATDHIILVDIEEEEDDQIPSTAVKEAYLN
jgi:hypothetical protein